MSMTRPGHSSLAWISAPLALILAACAPAPLPVPGQPSPAVLSDANISSVTQTYNAGEVRLEEFAVNRSTNQAVRTFAQTLARDHNASNSELSGILTTRKIEPEAYTATTQIQEAERTTLASLQNRSGTDFDRAFLDAEIEHHRWLLNQLDTNLIPSARDSSLRSYLQGMRKTEAAHLQEAERLRATLGSN